MFKITAYCEGDPETVREAVEIIERLLPYMTDNVVVSSEEVTKVKRAFKLASDDPQVLVNNVLDQAVDAYKSCYIDLASDHKSDTLRGICQGFSDALAAILDGTEKPADEVIEDLAVEQAGLGEDAR